MFVDFINDLKNGIHFLALSLSNIEMISMWNERLILTKDERENGNNGVGTSILFLGVSPKRWKQRFQYRNKSNNIKKHNRIK